MKISFYDKLKETLSNKELPSYDDILSLSDCVSCVLEEEFTYYRCRADNGETGSLLDFQSNDLPSVVVPDLHGRPDFLLNIINYKLPADFLGKEVTVYEALEQNLIRLIFVGDILHTEKTTKDRWLLAMDDFLDGNFTGIPMVEEMKESLSVWYGVFCLKNKFPEHCHILKGNHENILNVSNNGDFAFRKYAHEGAMVKAFIQEYYGDDVLYMIDCVERHLPLVVVGTNYVISHAEPRCAFSKKQIINAKMDGSVVAGLIWTDNNEAEEGSVPAIIKNLSKSEDISNYVYIGGHRWVNENYSLRQNGFYIQIHNPSKQNIALLRKDRKFNPDKDIAGVSK